MFTRVAVGRARVVREVRAAGPLMAALAAPATAREPWLTTALTVDAVHRRWARPAAVVVEPHLRERPEGLALLSLRRSGASTVVRLLGEGTPVPGGRPPGRLLAANPAIAALLADGIVGLLGTLRGPWTLRLAGLPLGDPTLAALADRLPTAALRTTRSSRLVDELAATGLAVWRSREPAELDRRLPGLLSAEPDRWARAFLRASARVHAAIGQVEVAVAGHGEQGRGVLLTLVDGADRWPWWSPEPSVGLGTEMGSPLVALTAQGGARVRKGLLSPRTGER